MAFMREETGRIKKMLHALHSPDGIAMPLKWSSAMATGVREIDLQHQELIQIVNDLTAAHRAGRSQQALAEVLPRLATYAMFHFGTEEAMMKSLMDGAGHFAAHVDEHRRFAERMDTLAARSPSAEELPELIAYLNAWLVEHIMRSDRKLGTLIRRNK